MDDTKELILRAHNGDKAARDKLVLENIGLVYSVSRRFAGRGYELEDINQIGTIGLLFLLSPQSIIPITVKSV